MKKLTVCNSPCVQRIQVNWTAVEFEPLACSICTGSWTLLVRLRCISPPKPPTQLATIHLWDYRHLPVISVISCCLLSASLLSMTTNQKECVSLCNGELHEYQTNFGIGQSPPLSEQCRCIVVMWVGGFGRLMQRSLTSKVRKLVNAASWRFKISAAVQLLEYAVHKVSYMYIRSKFPHFAISSKINLQQNGAKMYPSRDITFN